MSIRVMVVDDSAFMRKVISDILNEDKDINVVGTARNGKDALGKITKLFPDIITLDLEMPIMNGFSTLERIIKEYNIPVIILSSLTTEGADMTLKALEMGAIDFVTKPNNLFNFNSETEKKRIINKVKAVAGVKAVKKSNSNKSNIMIKSHNKNVLKKSNLQYLVSIGTSTGGPKALQAVIPLIPKDFNGSIVIVQHMPKGFTKSLANRLNSISDITVKEAENGELVKKGYCYIAPGDLHMLVIEKNSELYISLNENNLVSGHRPSVDLLMESVADINSRKLVGVMLTGMGADGSRGIKKLFDNGGYTIAQNEETCVVYGMPKSAVNMGAINVELPLNEIADAIISKTGV